MKLHSISAICLLFTAIGCGSSEPAAEAPVDAGATCAPTLTLCGDRCLDTSTDVDNCGACGTSCAPSETCKGGKCEVFCADGQAVCGGKCATLATDRQNCGGCGTACSAGEVCSAGKCATSCASDLTTCTGAGDDAGSARYCTNTKIDRLNCGACAKACASGEVCTDGACAIACPAGLTTCGDTCRDLKSDERNCGACGTTCAAGEICSAGACATSCPAPLALCDSSGDAGGDAGAKYCANLDADRFNCGGCGVTCAAGKVCAAGTCAASCASPLTKCGDVCTNTANDPGNCGGCGTACSPANANAAACVSSSCAYDVCKIGFGDCDGDLKNGCEIDLTTTVAHCGACGKTCAPANVDTASCASGACGYVACNAGFGDCDGARANGCEKPLDADLANCGACGKRCADGQTCTASACVGKPKSCAAILAANPAATSGTFEIDPDGAGPAASFDTYCEMAADGGGWTLLLKMNGSLMTATYGAPYWTDRASTLNPTSADLSLTEAKLAGYATLPFTRVRLGMHEGPLPLAARFIVADATAPSLWAAATGVAVPLSATKAQLMSLITDSSIQPNCGAVGFNMTNGISQLRIGVFGNNEADCLTPDSWVGFGAASSSGCNPANVTTGNESGCDSVGGDRTRPAWGFVFVK